MSNEIKTTKGRYKELDALRGIAALFVVLFHFTLGRPESKLGFNLGITGVDLFFIISGFVIFMSINNASSTKEFLINRFTRLYPTYWTCVSFTYLFYIMVCNTNNIQRSILLTDYLANLTMFQHYFKIKDIDGPYWTMLIEMLFYIFIAIVFSIKKLKHIVPIGLILLYLIIAQNFIITTKFWPQYSAFRLSLLLLNHFPLFFSGIVFYKIITEKENYFLLYVFIFFAYSMQVINTDMDGPFINHAEHTLMTTIYFGLFILFVNNKLFFIVNKPLLFLGKISFALYLIHQYLSTVFLIPLFYDKWHLNFWLSLIITLCIVLGLATLVTYYIEIPLGKRINNTFRGGVKLEKKNNGNV